MSEDETQPEGRRGDLRAIDGDAEGQPRPRRRTRAEREEQILSVAERRFARDGYYAVSMDAIAEEVGLSKQMVYNYVGSKEALYLSCFRRARFHLERAIDVGTTGATGPEEQLWFAALAFFTFVDEQRQQWSILNEQASARGGPFAGEVASARAEIATLVAQVLSDAAEAGGAEVQGNAQVTAFTIVGAAEGMARWWLDNPHVEKEYVVARMMDVLWMGLGNMMRDRFWDRPRVSDDPDGR